MPIKTHIKEKINKKHQAYRVRKQQEFYQEMIKTTGNKGTVRLFNTRTLAWLVVIVTAFLQLISLATTYEGSKVYFGGVALPLRLSAPLLFALSIQLIVFYISHIIRRQFKIWLVLVLVVATLCSTYFSYVGIYNHIHSPIDYLEERYRQIESSLSDQYELVMDESTNAMQSSIFKMIGAVSKEYALVSKEVEENKVVQQKLEGIKVDQGKLNAQTNALKKPNLANYGNNLTQYYEDMAKYNAAVGTMITDTTKQESDLKNELYQSQVNTLLGGKTKEEFLAESMQRETDKEQLEQLVSSLYNLVAAEGAEKTIGTKLEKVQQYVLDYVLKGMGSMETTKTLLTQLYTHVATLQEGKGLTTFKEDLNHFMLLQQKSEVLMKSTEQIMEEIKDAMPLYTAMQSEIKKATHLLNQTDKVRPIINLDAPKYRMHNLYVLPIKNLAEPTSGQAMAWFCLAFAILIDGLTLLFAFVEGKEKAPLSAQSNKDLVGESQGAMEELLLTHLLAHAPSQHQKDNLTDILNLLRGFMTRFTLIPEGLKSGYAMWGELSILEDYQGFIAILCQFNLATILTGEEIPIKGEETLPKHEKYVLVRTKFVVWANQKIVDLSTKEEYIKDLAKCL